MTRVERYEFIRLKLIDLIEDVELYLNLWRYDPGSSGTTGYKIGSVRGNLNKALETWENSYTSEAFVESIAKHKENEYWWCDECGIQFHTSQGVNEAGFGFCNKCLDDLNREANSKND